MEITGDIWTLSATEEENRRKNKRNERLIKDRRIRGGKTLFEQQEEDYYKPRRISNFCNNNYIE